MTLAYVVPRAATPSDDDRVLLAREVDSLDLPERLSVPALDDLAGHLMERLTPLLAYTDLSPVIWDQARVTLTIADEAEARHAGTRPRDVDEFVRWMRRDTRSWIVEPTERDVLVAPDFSPA
ncbi:MAG: hypothetical protein AAFP22_18690 [Planctomycetota bacterium]